MRRVGLLTAIAATAISVFPLDARQQTSAPATCDETTLNTQSYKLTTEEQALNVLRPQDRWWEPYGIWKGPHEIGDPNEGSARLAERAKELDDRNLLAHGYLARQYVVMAIDAKKAEDEWRRVIDGGAITWTASLYDVDPRSIFVLAFDRRGIRVFRFSQLAGELRTHFGVPDYPGPDRVEFWRAMGGCLPPNLDPEAEIAWSAVRELQPTTWTLRFELRDKVTISSDRRQQRTDDRLDVNLHPFTGEIDFRFGMTPWGARPVAADPEAYHMRVKQMLEMVFEVHQGASGASGCFGVHQGASGCFGVHQGASRCLQVLRGASGAMKCDTPLTAFGCAQLRHLEAPRSILKHPEAP